MGAAVGTQAGGGEDVVARARDLTEKNPSMSNEQVLKELEVPSGVTVEASAMATFREHASTRKWTDAELWEELVPKVHKAEEEAKAQPPCDAAAVAPADTTAEDLSTAQPQPSAAAKEASSESSAAAKASESSSSSDDLEKEESKTEATTELRKELSKQTSERAVQLSKQTSARAVQAAISGPKTNETKWAMSTEFKRPQMSKKTMYPPLPEGAARPLPRDVVGSFSCHGQSDVGKFKDNQDRGLVCYPFNCPAGSEARALFIVADGHGEFGHDVSDFVAKNLAEYLAALPYEGNDEVDFDAIKDCYNRVNAALVPPAFVADAATSGTTVVSAILRPTYVVTANTGDSRAIIGRAVSKAPPKARLPFVYKSFDLTVDHKPDSAAERDRISKCGGFVSQPEWSASHRVWVDEACTWPGLAMARSVGDHCVKSVGVTAEPDVQRYDFQPQDKFLVLATDGIWEFLSSEDVVQIVAVNLHSPKHKGKPNLAEICSQELIRCAIKQWKMNEDGYRDDITCTVVLLPALQRQEVVTIN